MSVQAIDDSYETLHLAWHPARIYDTTLRAYRWVLLAPWQIGAPPVPADPDAALDAAAPLFARRPYNDGQLSPTGQRIAALLRESGPLSPSVIAQRLDMPRNTVSSYIGNHPRAFERVGWTSQRQMLYRLIDTLGD